MNNLDSQISINNLDSQTAMIPLVSSCICCAQTPIPSMFCYYLGSSPQKDMLRSSQYSSRVQNYSVSSILMMTKLTSHSSDFLLIQTRFLVAQLFSDWYLHKPNLWLSLAILRVTTLLACRPLLRSSHPIMQKYIKRMPECDRRQHTSTETHTNLQAISFFLCQFNHLNNTGTFLIE